MFFLLEKLKDDLKIISHLKIIILFGVLYWIGGKIESYYGMKVIEDGEETDELINPISLFDAFYFSLVTQTTVGYGDTIPESRLTQVINIMQLLSIFGVYLV